MTAVLLLVSLGGGVGEAVGVAVGVGVGVAVGVGVGEGFGVEAGVGVGVAVGVVVELDTCCQVQVMLEGSVMLKLTPEAPPEAGTLPVPDQPMQLYV